MNEELRSVRRLFIATIAISFLNFLVIPVQLYNEYFYKAWVSTRFGLLYVLYRSGENPGIFLLYLIIPLFVLSLLVWLAGLRRLIRSKIFTTLGQSTRVSLVILVILSTIFIIAAPYSALRIRRAISVVQNENNLKKTYDPERIIKESGFTAEEIDKIINDLNRSKDVNIIAGHPDFRDAKWGYIYGIKKINENEVEINTGYVCGPLCGQGATYHGKKIEGVWKFELIDGWIS